MPDQPFAFDGRLYRKLERGFEQVLSLWDADEDIHLITLATFGLNAAGVPSIDQLTLMPVDEHWIPLRDTFEGRLVQRLIHERHRFIKILASASQADTVQPSVALTDAGDKPFFLHISVDPPGAANCGEAGRQLAANHWVWHVYDEPMPTLPGGTANERTNGVPGV